jgi:hypothetical protein
MKGFWLIFHQLHHSPSRIEAVTSFYKHPIEILKDTTEFAERCGFPKDAEHKLKEILLFKDVYKSRKK